MSLHLEAGLSIILEATVCYKTSQRFPYSMTICSSKKSIYDLFVPAQPQPFTDPVTGLHDSGEKVERASRESQTSPACPGQCWAALPGAWQAAQVLAAVTSIPLLLESKLRPPQPILPKPEVFHCLPQREKHFAWCSAARGSKWLQTLTDTDNSLMAGRNDTLFRVKEPEPAISRAQLGASLLSNSTRVAERIKGCRAAPELVFASPRSCRHTVLLSQGPGLSPNRSILPKKLLVAIKPRNPVASRAGAGYFQTPLESSQAHRI